MMIKVQMQRLFFVFSMLFFSCGGNILAAETLLSDPPTTNNSFYCLYDNTAISPPLEATCDCPTGDADIGWFDAEFGGNLVASGATFHPITAGLVPDDVAGVYTYFVECTCDFMMSSRTSATFEVFDCNLSTCTASNSCVHWLVMEDTGCNGWDGASLDLSINQNPITNYKVTAVDANGCLEVVPLCLNDGDVIDLTYWNGAFEEEHGFRVLNQFGYIATDDTGNPLHFEAAPPANTPLSFQATCSTDCTDTQDVTIRITLGTTPAEQSWAVHSNAGGGAAGTPIFFIDGTNYTGMSPGTTLTYNLSLDMCTDYAFLCYDDATTTWNGGTWEIIASNPAYGSLITDINDPLVGNQLLLDGPADPNFVTEDRVEFTIPCQNEYGTEIGFSDTGSTNCLFTGSISLREPYVCQPNSYHATPPTCVNETVTLAIDGDPNNTQIFPGPFVYTNGFYELPLSSVPLGCHTVTHQVTYCDGIISTQTTNLYLSCNNGTPSYTVNSYDLDCTHPEAMNAFYNHTETYTGSATLPFTVMDNGPGLQGNVFIPINLPEGASIEEIHDIEVGIDLTHNDLSDLEIILHAPTAMGLPPMTLATFGEVYTNNTFLASTSTNADFGSTIGMPTIPTESTSPTNIIEETLGTALPSNVGGTWYIQVLDSRSVSPNPAYGGGIIQAVSIALTSGFPTPTLAYDCSFQSISLLNQTLMETNCDQSDGYGAYIERVWEVTDMNGSVTTATQTVGLVFPNLSDITLPENLDIACTGLTANDYPPSATNEPTFGSFPLDNTTTQVCDISLTYEDQILPTCGLGFKMIRIWTIANWCTGAEITHEQTIIVEDTEGPVIDTTPLTIGTDPYDCEISLSDFTYSDACSTALTSAIAYHTQGGGVYDPNNLVTVDLLSGEEIALPEGTHEVQLNFRDQCLNISQELIIINVMDDTAPVAICSDQLPIQLGTDGTGSLSVNNVDGGSYDNCGDVTLEVRRTDGCLGATPWASSVPFECCDAGELVTVELRVTDEVGNTNVCWKQVLVEEDAPTISCPADKTIDCDDPEVANPFDPLVSASDNCSNVTTSFTDSGELDQCMAGVLTRTWTADDGDPSSPNVSCTQRVFVHHISDFVVQFPADVTITDACPDDLSATGEPNISDDDCELIAVNHDDLLLTIVPDACYKIERTWTVINWCVYDQGAANTDLGSPEPLPRTYRDDGDGYFRWVQTIKVNDTQGPQITCPSDLTFCDMTDGCEGEAQLTITATDQPACSSGSSIEYSYEIDAFNDGVYDVIDSGNDATGIYPYGTHRIKWIVEDGCDNTSTCEYLFTIEDCENPTPVCLNGISVPGSGAGSDTCVQILASDMLEYAFDNCSDDAFVENTAKIRREGDTAPPQPSIELCCADVGTVIVEVWVEDEAGNSDYCTTYINVEQSICVCNDDTEAPVPTCINSTDVEVAGNACTTVVANTLLNTVSDNCSSNAYLVNNATLRLLGDANPPLPTIDFCASDAGTQVVEVHITDEAGNSDFCLSVVNVNYEPCETTIVLPNDPISNNGYFAEQAVISSGVVGPYGNVVFTAGDSIVLEPGFEVIIGSLFQAYIQECPAAADSETENK